MSIPTFTSGRRTLVACTALALATIQVINWSVFQNDDFKNSPRQLSSNKSDSSNPKSPVRKWTLLIPADGPDPHPQEVIDAIRRQDPGPLDPLCSTTSQVMITNPKHLHKNGFGPMKLLSLNAEGKPKTIGGDEYYVTYTANEKRHDYQSPDAVAHIIDLEDGSYELHFVQPIGPNVNDKPRPTSAFESEVGLLEINLEYTCGIGAFSPPSKSNWITGGYIQSHWEAVVESPMIPSITMAKDRPMPQEFGSKFRNYDGIYAVGNSLMRMWVMENRPNFYYSADYLFPLNMDTLAGWFTTIDTLLQEHPEAKGGNCAIVLGSGVWDTVMGEASMESHIEAMEKYIEGVKTRAPLADIYWKSMTGLHVSVFRESGVMGNIKTARDRLRYLSRSRAKAIYQAQIEVVERMKIPYLDMYNMTYEAQEWHNKNDALHYQYKFNEFLMDYFYPDDPLHSHDPLLTYVTKRSLVTF